MKTRMAAFAVLGLLTAACATTTTAPRRQFDDIPLPTGLTYQLDRSVMIESPNSHPPRPFYELEEFLPDRPPALVVFFQPFSDLMRAVEGACIDVRGRHNRPSRIGHLEGKDGAIGKPRLDRLTN